MTFDHEDHRTILREILQRASIPALASKQMAAFLSAIDAATIADPAPHRSAAPFLGNGHVQPEQV